MTAWNRPPGFEPIPHFKKDDPRNSDAAHARLAKIRKQERSTDRASRPCVPVYLPPEVNQYFETAASKRGISRDTLIRIILFKIAAKPSLVDIIMEDYEVEEVTIRSFSRSRWQ